jgi:hypothetical protein
MAFRLVQARYDDETLRAYVELRDADADGGEMIVTAIFSLRYSRTLTAWELEQEAGRT